MEGLPGSKEQRRRDAIGGYKGQKAMLIAILHRVSVMLGWLVVRATSISDLRCAVLNPTARRPRRSISLCPRNKLPIATIL